MFWKKESFSLQLLVLSPDRLERCPWIELWWKLLLSCSCLVGSYFRWGVPGFVCFDMLTACSKQQKLDCQQKHMNRLKTDTLNSCSSALTYTNCCNVPVNALAATVANDTLCTLAVWHITTQFIQPPAKTTCAFLRFNSYSHIGIWEGTNSHTILRRSLN